MAKQFNTRVQNKIDLEKNWEKATFIPLAGEFIIYAPDENYTHSRLKIGDGKQKINDLPFLTYTAYDIAIAGGFKGTEIEWIESLNGVGIEEFNIEELTSGNGGETKADIKLTDGTEKTFSVFNGQGIDRFDVNQLSTGNGGETKINIDLSTGQKETFSIFNGQGIDKFDVNQLSTGNGGKTQISIDLSDGTKKIFDIVNGQGIEEFSINKISEGHGGETQCLISLSNGDYKEFSVYNGQGIDRFDVNQLSEGHGGETKIDIELSTGQKETFSVYNGQGIEEFIVNKLSTGNGGETKVTFSLSNGQEETFSIFNGQGINSLDVNKISEGHGGETKLTFSLSDGTQKTFSILNGHGIDNLDINKLTSGNGGETKLTFSLSNGQEETFSIFNGQGINSLDVNKISEGNGGETQLNFSLSDGTKKTFSIFNGEKGETGTGISSISTESNLEGTNFTVSLDDNSDPTSFFIQNGKITEAQLNETVRQITEKIQLKSRTYSFNTTSEMTSWLQSLSLEQIKELHLGDVFLIRDIGVPDYWWDPISTEATTIAEYMDKDIIIEGKGACRILETSKLNLSGYCGLDHKKSETDTLSGIKDLSNYKIRVAEDGDEGKENYITLIIPKGVM